MPGEGARFDFEDKKLLDGGDYPQRLQIAHEFEDKIDIQRELAKAEASLDEIKENGDTEPINAVRMDLGESKPDIQPIGVEAKVPEISPEIRNAEPVAEQKIETVTAPENQTVVTDMETPIKVVSSLPETPIKTDISEVPLGFEKIEPPTEQKTEIVSASEPNSAVEPVVNEIPIHIAKENPVAEPEAMPLIPIVETPINNANTLEAGAETGVKVMINNTNETVVPEKIESGFPVANIDNNIVQEKPDVESDSEKINEIYKEVGKKIFDCWSQYKTIPERSQQIDMVLKFAGEISFINEDTENKVAEGKNFDIYSPIVETLKKIKNRSELVLANKSLEKPIELKSIEEGSNEQESILLGSLKELANENANVMDNFLYDLGEIILYRRDEDEKSEQETPVVQLKKEMGRDELGKALIELTKEEIKQHGDIPDSTILNSVFEDKFGQHVKGLGLFDLGIMTRRNEVIMDTAKSKGIDNIVRLTKAFNSHLQAKRAAKEKATQDFLEQKLTQMAA